MIRYFLEAAAEMYSECKVLPHEGPIVSIPPGIQNTVVRSQADEFLFKEFEKLREDESSDAPDKTTLDKLLNLIRSLGGTFYQILISDRSERRVFSIAFSDEPDEEIRTVLRLGIHLGYFHVSAIGNKDGTGRTPLYVMNRRLAPHFKLDPTSFAGYQFVTSDRIHEAMRKPDTLLRKIKSAGVDSVFEDFQLKLFDSRDTK